MNLLPHSPDRTLLPQNEGEEAVIRDLARFRYALRKFLRFSENAARQCGVTPQQHQLMLGVAGFTGHGTATVSELAEFLQERPHSVVGLIERAAQHNLVVRTQDQVDRRVVNVSLTAAGREILAKLSRLHREEAWRIQELLDAPRTGILPADETEKAERSGAKHKTGEDRTPQNLA